MQREDSNLDPRLAQELHNWQANEKLQNAERINVQVDRNSFIATRNALTNAFVGLSGAIDEAVKAYVNHTNAVLDGVGGQTLDISGLMQPIMGLNHLSAIAAQAYQNGSAFPAGVQLNPDGTKKKRQYKPRDPNAPKRPLTAYFRYLQEQRPIIQAELQAQGTNTETGKAGDISKIATERWNALPKEKQVPYRKAYEKEMHKYYADVKEYKGTDAVLDEEGEEGEATLPTIAGAIAPVPKDEEDSEEDDSDDSDDDADSSDESEDEPAPPPPPPPPPPPAPVEKKPKTPKSSQKKAKAGADPVAPVQQFSSLHAEPIIPPAPVMASSSPTRKRKADKDVTEESAKKRTKKTKAQKEAEDAAAAAAQLIPEPEVEAEKPKKEKKKKRKSEAAA